MVIKDIVGRKTELEILNGVLSSNEAEFVAVYGRRRVGKTFLIRHFFRGEASCVFFELTGHKNGTLKEQLENFTLALQNTFLDKIPIKSPTNWKNAFLLLTDLAKKEIEKGKKVVIFFDELPWLAAKKSKFMQALDYIWNTVWTDIDQLKLIVCGSAASWMLDNLVHAKGGLHNRLTRKMALQPFTLFETQEYLESRGIHLDQQQIVEIYMVMGGVPFYLKSISKGLSAAQNIDNLCFKKDGLLIEEFEILFSSLFDSSGEHIEIVRALAKHKKGMTQNEILNETKLTSGGTFKKRLKELEAAGFINSIAPYKKEKKGSILRLIDEYSYFYLKWIEQYAKKGGAHHWEMIIQTPIWYNWAGYAFESVCYKHIAQIRSALRIDMMAIEVSGWSSVSKDKNEKGAQIDLLLDRADRIITLCEIKYSQEKFVVTKEISDNIKNKIDVFRNQTKTNKNIFVALITPYGIKENDYSRVLISNIVTLKEMFC